VDKVSDSAISRWCEPELIVPLCSVRSELAYCLVEDTKTASSDIGSRLSSVTYRITIRGSGLRKKVSFYHRKLLYASFIKP
jgi:hypothetical protein